MKLAHGRSEEIEADIYFFLWKFEQLKKILDTIMPNEDCEDKLWKCQWVCFTDKRKVVCCVLEDNCKKADFEKVLNHEIIHWIHYLMEYLWHGMWYDGWAEMFAYYTAYRIEKWKEFLSGKKKNKKKKK